MIEGAQLQPSDATQGADVVVGQTLGKYEILQRLAAGGMAEIFLARMVGMLGFDKLVVIKRILPHLASRNDFIEMFLDEARIASTLAHANIVATHEVGVHGKSYYIVMEYLAGEDVRGLLRALIRRRERLPIEHALEIAIGVAAGLHYAHEKRDRDGKRLDIVHRDVTPQNVIVTWDGAVKLVDFGIAKASNRINETRSGSFKGKVPYMSPEQCRGEPLDRRSDIFSLGILLHELTLCRRLFRGDTDFQILKQIAEGPIPSPRDVDVNYDTRLDAIVMKALERDPARRFQTARELQVALEELAHDLRLRCSSRALGDFMHGLFADKIGAWEEAAAAGDRGKLEAHLAERAAERDADLAAEEVSQRAAFAEPPPSDVQLSSLPDAALAPSRRRGPLLVIVLLMLVAAVGLAGWRVRDRLRAPLHAVAATPAAASARSATAARAPAGQAAPALELPAPVVDAPGAPVAATAAVVVTTTPSGATLVLDGTPLVEKSPATLSVSAGVTHTLEVRGGGHGGVAQRFALNAGEEATLEIDLRRAHHHELHRAPAAHPGSSSHAAAPAATSAPSTAPAPAATPAPKQHGDGTLVLASSPWCTVTVDGKARGTTPVSLTLAAGAHEVVLANPEFKIRRTLAVELEPGQTVRKSLDFAPE